MGLFFIIEYIILKFHRGAILWDIELLPALFWDSTVATANSVPEPTL